MSQCHSKHRFSEAEGPSRSWKPIYTECLRTSAPASSGSCLGTQAGRLKQHLRLSRVPAGLDVKHEQTQLEATPSFYKPRKTKCLFSEESKQRTVPEPNGHPGCPHPGSELCPPLGAIAGKVEVTQRIAPEVVADKQTTVWGSIHTRHCFLCTHTSAAQTPAPRCWGVK